MPHADFVHLRVHSAFSLSEGAIKPDKIAALAYKFVEQPGRSFIRRRFRARRASA